MPTITVAAKRRIRSRHYVVYAAICLLLGSNWPAVRVLVRDVPPLRSAGICYLVSCACMLLAATGERSIFPGHIGDYGRLALMGLLLLAIPTSAISWAEQYINASLTAVLYAGLPLAVAILVRVVHRKSVPCRAVVAMVVGLAGIVALFFSGVPTSFIGRIAAVAVAVSVFVCASGVIYVAAAPKHLTTRRALAVQFAMCAAFTLSVSTLVESNRASHWNLSSIGATLFIGVFCTALMVLLYYWLLSQMAAFQVATIDLVVPVVAFAEGVMFLREAVTATMVVAAVVVIGSTTFVLRSTADAHGRPQTE